MTTKKKKLLLILLPPALLCCAAGGYFLFRPSPPEAPLSPEDQVRRDFRQAFDPTEPTLWRLNSLRKSFSTVRGLPKDRRHTLMVEALAGAMDGTLRDFAALPADQKAERARLLQQDAERTFAYFRTLPREKQRRAVGILMNTPEGRAQFNQAVNTATNVLSPADRELLGPTIKTWKTMLESVR